jgi:hypothetical protein
MSMPNAQINEQVAAEVSKFRGLVDKFPAHNFFGDDNRAAIDAQCAAK